MILEVENMRVGVIMGGNSSEKEISLMTGEEMIAHLDKDKYEVVRVELNDKDDLIEKVKDLDVALLALHGKYGEDGTIQGTLETLGIPYTGSGVLSSSMCMDKNITKKLIRYEGVPTPEWILLTKTDEVNMDELDRLVYPLVVKPNSGGSSVGVKIVHSPDEIQAAISEVFKWDSEVLIEEHIKGDEITCAVFDGEMWPVLAIGHTAEFFDYKAKYDAGAATEDVVELPAELHERVKKAALACYQSLKCSVYSRIDMMVKDGIPYVMEINTLPGMTKNSLLPKSAQAIGIPYSQLLDKIIETSLKVRAEEGLIK
jgi:D-alanine-D-alanine ligase